MPLIQVYAINWLDGSVKWQYMTQNELVGSPALDSNGNIYIGSKDSFIYCVKPDGTLKWKFQIDSAVTSSPVVSSQNVVYVTTESKIYAFSSEGSSLWKETNDGGKTYVDGLSFSAIQSSPAIDTNGTIYVSAGYNNMFSFCAINSDGSLKWGLSLPGVGSSSPTVNDNGIVYVAGDPSAMSSSEAPGNSVRHGYC